jgi:hypothetical protein
LASPSRLLREGESELIARVDHDHFRLHRLVGEGEGGDDDAVARQKVSRGGAVDDDFPFAGGERNGVGFDACTAADVPHGHLFTRNDIGELHQRLVDPDAADVIHVRRRDDGVVDLRFADGAKVHTAMVAHAERRLLLRLQEASGEPRDGTHQ